MGEGFLPPGKRRRDGGRGCRVIYPRQPGRAIPERPANRFLVNRIRVHRVGIFYLPAAGNG